MNTTTFASAVSAIATVIEMLVRLAVLILIALVVAHEFGIRIGVGPKPTAQAVVYIAGAWFLYRGGRV